MNTSDARIQKGYEFSNCELYKSRDGNTRIPASNKIWGGKDMNLETYIAMACQSSLRGVKGAKFIELIKTTDIDKDLACRMVCNGNKKEWYSIRRSLTNMSKKLDNEYSPVEFVKILDKIKDGEPVYSTWVKVDYAGPNADSPNFAVVPTKYLPSILKACNTKIDLDTYITVLYLTQRYKPKEGLKISPRMYAKDHLDYSDRHIANALTRLLTMGLIEAFYNYSFRCNYKTGKGHPVTYRNVQAVDIDVWAERFMANEDIINNPVVEFPDKEITYDEFIKLVPKNARVTIEEE